MVNRIKIPHKYKLLGIALLAFSLQHYNTSYAVEPQTPEPAQPVAPATPATPAPVATTPPPAAPNYTADIIAQMIKGMIASSPWQKEAMTEIYRLSDHRLIWLNNKNTDVALKLLAEMPASKGLHSEDYAVQWLNTRWQELKASADPSFEELALFDATLSNSLLSYYSDLRHGRVNPHKVSFDFQVNKEHLKLAQWTLNASKDGSLNTLAENLEPKLIFYRNLRRAFNQYQQAAQENKNLQFKFSQPLLENDSDPQVIPLRQLLTTLGDVIPSKNSSNAKSSVYDLALIAGVKNFQYRHGLATTGLLNKETVAMLNVPLEYRISQIELGLERMRWVPDQTEGRLIVVNIPSFRLWAFDAINDPKSKPLTMRVVVGEAEDKQTPSLSSTMNQIEFRPTWTVPQSIIKNEFLDKLENNPSYFTKRHMKVTYRDNGEISIRQAAGDKNALGLVKFLFPNNHAVYFHDTTAQKYFSRSRRDFSHGCVRLANPDLLAEFVLKKQTGAWTPEKIDTAMHKGGSKRVVLDNPIPVMILYNSAMAIDNTGVAFFQDIYGHDETLKQALAAKQKAYTNSAKKRLK
jgi:murein L,D-transpeptidase YcbB/YkuD